jgi:hypothetical protein
MPATGRRPPPHAVLEAGSSRIAEARNHDVTQNTRIIGPDKCYRVVAGPQEEF